MGDKDTVIQLLEQPQAQEKIIVERYPVVKKDEKVVIDYVVKEFKRYKRYHKDWMDRCEMIYRHWMQEPLMRDEEWMNGVPIPLITESEQTISPRVHTALFPNDAPVDVKAEGDSPAGQAIRIKGIIQHYFRINNVDTECIPSIQQCTLYGTGYAEAGSWCVKRGWTVENFMRTYGITESRPDFKSVDFFEIFPHPAKKCMNDSLPVIRRQVIDAQALRMLQLNPHFKFQNLQKALDSEFPPDEGDKLTEAQKGDQYELLTYWGGYDDKIFKDEKVVERLAVPYWIMIVNRKVLVRCIPNPYNHQIAPYVKFTLFENPKSRWFGIGVGQMGQATQERINKLVNQRLDNVDLVLNKQGFYNGNDPLINKMKLQTSRPGQWHKVTDTVSSIRWMDVPDVTQSAYKEEELAKQDFRMVTGAVAQFMPTEQGQHRTAMGIQLLQGAAGVRFQPVLKKMEDDFIQQTAMFFFSNLKQFMTEDEWVLITGKNGEQAPILITPQQIQAKVFFLPTGISETVNKEIQVQQLLRYKEITMNDPTVNRQEINKRIAELFGFKDLHKLLTPIQPIGQDGLPTQTMMQIQQRLAEGANPQQIKNEILGPRPAPIPLAPPRGGQPQ